MEIKKSSHADLDARRTEGFLLGVIVVLAGLFVALEYDWTVHDSTSSEALDDIVRELDIAALKEEEERIPLIKQPTQQIQQSAEKIEIVADDKELSPEEPTPQSTDSTVPDKSAVEDKPVEPEATDLQNRPLDIKVVEQLPEFPGGAVELMKWLTANLRYPETARQRRQQGKVVAQFVVNADGTLSDFEIVSSVTADLDGEALRVLRMMPPWKAGQQHQKPCRTMVCIPIVFKL